MDEEVKNEADKIFSEYAKATEDIKTERKNFLREYRERLEKEKIKEIKSNF